MNCWRCNSRIDDYGWCPSCDYPSFRAAASRVVIPRGLKLEAVALRKSGQRLSPEIARTGKLIFVENSCNDVHVFLLHSAIDILVAAEHPEPSTQPEPKRLATYIKG
jgi:hypothetical protein